MPRYAVSIIVPCLNESENLKELIPYLEEQLEGQGYELILVDSLHSDDEVGQMDVVTRHRYIASDKCSRATQLQLGAEIAQNDILYFLHADTRPPKGFMEYISKSLDSGDDFGMFAYRFDRTSFLLDINSRFTTRDGIFSGGGDQGLFIRSSVFKEVGGYNEQLGIMEDFELFWRLKEKEYAYSILPEKGQVSARKYEMNSYLKVQLVNLVTLLGFKWGVDPDRLKRFYSRAL
jgi:rSAM/selenodomain-associated transferase 2